MADWRDIPMRMINWNAVSAHIGRSARPLRRLSTTIRPEDTPKPFCRGAWRDMTLGQVADLGRREILRHSDIGPTALAALQHVIDLAAAGKLPQTQGPANDALRPTEKRK